MNFGLTKSEAITEAGEAAVNLHYLSRYGTSEEKRQADEDYQKIADCLNLMSAMLVKIQDLFTQLTVMDIDE